MNPKGIEDAKSPELRGSAAAMRRAARRAREVARMTRTRLIIARNGAWEAIDPSAEPNPEGPSSAP